MTENAEEPATYWNGEPTPCERVVVKVGEAPHGWWCAGLVGTERDAVVVRYGSRTFYLDDEDGAGWTKVTEAKGSPHYGHASLPATSEIVRHRA